VGFEGLTEGRSCIVAVRSLAALRPRCLPTTGRPHGAAVLEYFVDLSHGWYTSFLKTFVLVQGSLSSGMTMF